MAHSGGHRPRRPPRLLATSNGEVEDVPIVEDQDHVVELVAKPCGTSKRPEKLGIGVALAVPPGGSWTLGRPFPLLL